MRVLVCGVDGYLGWTLAAYLAARGHEVGGIDNFARRKWVKELRSQSVISIACDGMRREAFRECFSRPMTFFRYTMRDKGGVRGACRDFSPEAIVHLAEQPSAAYSMIDCAHAVETQENNIRGTLNLLYAMKDVCPDAHLVKLGSMGEYGTPDSLIPEGVFPGDCWWGFGECDDASHMGDLGGLLFPRRAGSWYHQSKVHDTHNIEMACRLWGLRSTDVMQGIVYGTRVDELGDDPRMATRCDIDECFGTIVHRFCAQAVIGMPLTVYGSGQQTRGLLPLRDSMKCLTLALENPPEAGEYRTFNQFADTHSVLELASVVKCAAGEMGKGVRIQKIDNPRIEAEHHHYEPVCESLKRLGYKPSSNIDADMRAIIEDMLPHRDRIEEVKDVLTPKVKWK